MVGKNSALLALLARVVALRAILRIALVRLTLAPTLPLTLALPLALALVRIASFTLLLTHSSFTSSLLATMGRDSGSTCLQAPCHRVDA